MWVADAGSGAIAKIDPDSNTVVARTTLHGWLSDLIVGDGFVWVSIVDDEKLFKLGEDDLSVQRTFATGTDPERLATTGGSVWVTNTAGKTVSLIAEDSGARQALLTGAAPSSLRVHGRLVWIGAARPPRLLPPGEEELRIGLNSPLHVDPVQRGAPIDEQLSYLTCANLLDYPDSAGPDGRRLRPEIAASVPTLSADGRTYRFRIRPGFRFSPPSNEPVTAETFRHTIERTLSPDAHPVWGYAADIVGAADYSAGKAAHISGISVSGDELSISLVRPAGDFLTRLSMPVFCPVPLSVSLDPTRAPSLVPSAGPYYVTSVDTHRVVLERNPNYIGARPRRPARIVFVNGTPTPRAVALTDSGRLDYLPPDYSNNSPLEPGGVLDRRFGPSSAAARFGRQRYFLHVRPLVDTMVFNTRRPLFADVRLRRAVSYALDRRVLARSYFDAPAERIIPAAVPGYAAAPRAYPPEEPDLPAAQRLAGTKRRTAVLYAPCDAALAKPAAIVRSELGRIGIRVSIVSRPAVCDSKEIATGFAHADLIIGTNVGFGPTNRDPAPFLDGAVAFGAWGSPLPPGPWSSPTFKARLANAEALSGRARVAAYRRLDAEFERMAPLAVYGAFQYDEYFGPRVGCKLFQAFYLEVDLGALCVRQAPSP